MLTHENSKIREAVKAIFKAFIINTVEEGVQLMKKVDISNMTLMPDVFHMNIEDKDIRS